MSDAVVVVLAGALASGAAAVAADDVRSVPLTVPSRSSGAVTSARLVRMSAAETGLTFTNRLGPGAASENQIRLNGSGVAAGDIDGDGRCDLVFAALEGGPRLYRNLGQWRFEDVTGGSPDLGFERQFCSGVVLSDVDGDGDPDLLLNAIGRGTRLFVNDGRGHFGLRPDAGLASRNGPASLALADVDGDGDVDLYVANYRTTTIRSTGFSVLRVNGKRVIRPEDRDRLEYLPDGRILEHGEPDALYLNDGTGRFAEVAWTDGHFLDADGRPLARAPFDWSLSAMFRDVNGDGAPDLYVCGDFHSPDHLWINDGKGRFREASRTVFRNSPTFSMTVDFADVDRDGHDDFFVADMLDPRRLQRVMQSSGIMAAAGDFETQASRPQLNRNVLQLSRGDGTYAEVAQAFGIEATGWTWGVAFLDVDLDGYEDLLGTTGHLFDTQDLDANARIEAGGPYPPDMIPQKLLMYPALPMEKIAYRNVGGRHFEDVGRAWGFADGAGAAHGLCLVDLDEDGDLDVVVNGLNQAAAVYRNEATEPRVAIRLTGRRGNTAGLGARLRLEGGAVPVQAQEIMAGGRYLSSDQPQRVFAAGTNAAMKLAVRWRSGATSVVTQVAANRLYVLAEPEEAPVAPAAGGQPAARPEAGTWFTDASARLGHRHFDLPYDDFARQPLLSRRLSQSGPGVGWIDLDRDGRDDLVVGSGRGGRLTAFLNSGDGTFRRVEGQAADADQLAVVAWSGGGDGARALVVISAYESSEAGRSGSVAGVGADGGLRTELELPGLDHPGPMAWGDMDGDGELDLFVGGQARGGRYPEAGPSGVWTRRGGRWVAREDVGQALAGAGLVQGALWSDLDGDGGPELVLACEWGPIRVFRREAGGLKEVTESWGLASLVGWWTGIASGDFDGDGRLDLVAGNWGDNHRCRVTPERGWRLYHGDASGAGQVDLIEAYFEPGLGKWVPERDLNALRGSLPWLSARFPHHRAFAAASVEEMLGERFAGLNVLEARRLSSTALLNRGGRFEARPLPDAAQRSVAWGVNVADFDGDGALDVFLGQNFFAVTPARSRLDAGRGLILRGDGRGGFEPVPGQVSGIEVYGESRGSAVADYDGDGRPDLVVSQNGSDTRLFRNATGKPGLRVRFAAGPGNPTGIGTVARMKSAAGGAAWGPAQEVHAGSGYASQDSTLLVLPRGDPAEECVVQVRWPGGGESEHRIPTGAVNVLLERPAAAGSSRP